MAGEDRRQRLDQLPTGCACLAIDARLSAAMDMRFEPTTALLVSTVIMPPIPVICGGRATCFDAAQPLLMSFPLRFSPTGY